MIQALVRTPVGTRICHPNLGSPRTPAGRGTNVGCRLSAVSYLPLGVLP